MPLRNSDASFLADGAVKTQVEV